MDKFTKKQINRRKISYIIKNDIAKKRENNQDWQNKKIKI